MIFQDIQSMDENRSWHSTFQSLNVKAKENAGSQKLGKSSENRIYNRYRDVVPYDHSLVRLRNSDTEYINANLVKGPLANTCQHFWEMVWEQNVHSIVMLNRVVEKNQLKCHQYWPLSGSLIMGDIKVTVKEEEDYNEFLVRILEVEHLKEEDIREVHHFHYVAWPDFGVPSSPQGFLKYLLKVQEHQASINGVGPPVIHCSAGIGRSGTFALIDAALTEIQQNNDMMDYDVKRVLLEMRTYRAGLIQTTEQLRFSYIAILEGANKVAPEAYGAAYWEMVNRDESEPEGPERPDKRSVESESDEEPRPKEPRKHDPTPDSSGTESGEDEIVNLSDIDADVGSASNWREGDEEPATDLYKNSDSVSDQLAAEEKGFPEVVITVTKASSESVSQVEEDTKNKETDKGGTKEENQPKQTQGAHTESFEAEQESEDREKALAERPVQTTSPVTEDAATIPEGSVPEGRHDRLDVNDEDDLVGSKSIHDFEEERNENESNVETVSSGRFPSSFNLVDSEDVVSTDSMEEIVSRWQSGDGENAEPSDTGDTSQPRPKRSAMRTNSAEGKRKSVSFVHENGESEQGVQGEASHEEGNATADVDERATESSELRRRQIRERKQNLSDKVDSIKKNMKKEEGGNSVLGKTMVGLVLCVVVAGVAFLYYRYQS